ncbi:MAG: AmmeMemoRadiSam system protein A [candidate division WOR-3 bacterium]
MQNLQLSKDEKITLLKLARKALENKFSGQKDPVLTDPTENLKAFCGAFVTLRKHNQLRGCIGYIKGIKPLWEEIVNLAKEAAFHDPRFYPLRPEELKEVEIEISVLTPLQKISDTSLIEVGKHGILIKRGFFQGLLLPQVAIEENWDRETFLDHTCLKAGLYPGCWKDEKTEIYIFEALVFSEKEVGLK